MWTGEVRASGMFLFPNIAGKKKILDVSKKRRRRFPTKQHKSGCYPGSQQQFWVREVEQCWQSWTRACSQTTPRLEGERKCSQATKTQEVCSTEARRENLFGGSTQRGVKGIREDVPPPPQGMWEGGLSHASVQIKVLREHSGLKEKEPCIHSTRV